MAFIKFCLAVFCLVVLCNATYAPERDLAKHLINAAKENGLAGRPVAKFSDALKVGIGFELVKVFSVDSADQVTVFSFLKLSWQDPALAYDPSKFDGASIVSIPADSVWKPDIVPYNDFYNDGSDYLKNVNSADVLVSPDGTVIWVPRLKLRTSCKTDGSDKLNCNIIFGSWVYDTAKIDITFMDGTADVGVSDLQPTPGIDVVSHSASIKDKEYACCPGLKYRQVNFDFAIKHTKAATGQCDKH